MSDTQQWQLTREEQVSIERSRELARAVNAAEREVLAAARAWWQAPRPRRAAQDRLYRAVVAAEQAKAVLLAHCQAGVP